MPGQKEINVSVASTGELPTAGLTALELEALFADCFPGTHLVGGAPEPLYVPAGETGGTAYLYYREDFAASALHEVAHWCIAGAERRKLEDFGYVYIPPPRSPAEQAQFFAFELKVQSLEAIFALAAGHEFQVSVDNLTWAPDDFTDVVASAIPERRQWLTTRAGARALSFQNRLIRFRESRLQNQAANPDRSEGPSWSA